MVDTAIDFGAAEVAEPDAHDDGVDGDAAVDVVDAPAFCGNGSVDPGEECDDGLGADTTHRRTCTAACRALDLLAIPAPVGDAGPLSFERTLGAGRHPIAAGPAGLAVAFSEPSPSPSRVALTTFSSKGVASDLIIPFATGTTTPLQANPVVAWTSSLVAVAWNDLGGDGDGLGVALRMVDPLVPPSGAPSHANVSSDYGQYDPDILWTGGELIVAWVDNSIVAHGTDIKYRRFSSTLVPLSAELELASTLDDEADVALAPFGSGWASCWRSARGGLESIQARAGAVAWSVGPFLPGPYGSKPALVTLDATHLALVFVKGVDGASAFELHVSVLDIATPGAVVSTKVVTKERPAQPNAIRVGSHVYLAWREDAAVGAVPGEELYLKEVEWSTSLDLSAPAIRLPREPAHAVGDQRSPALAPLSGSLATAWDDLSGEFATRGTDVVVGVAGVPILRATETDGGLDASAD